MTTKISNLRAEQQVVIGELIERDTRNLIARWAARAKEEQPTAARVHHEVLVDHLPSYLIHLGRSLTAAGDDSAEIRRWAEEHGDQRWDNGWSITEVVRDYQLLRIVLIEYLEEELNRGLGSRENLVLNVAIDDAIAGSVSAFVASQARPGMSSRREAMDLLLNVLGTVGHELRNPLAPLANSVELLRLAGMDAARIELTRQVMERQLRVLGRLVDDLMDLPRLARGKMSLKQERLDFAQIVRSCVEDRRKSIESSGLSLSLELPSTPVWVIGDETRLTQAIGNLIGNAQKFTDRGGSLIVKLVRNDARRAVVTVTDTGIGIDAAVLPNVFEAYVQADSSLDRSRSGLGLGLALVKGVVELHGGTVTATSEGPGKGASFIIEIPETESKAPTESVNAPTPPSTEQEERVPVLGRKVLVIEDNFDSAESLRMYLEIFGHSVTVARSGPEGINAAADSPPEVVICDVGLPGMDGYSVAAEIRNAVSPASKITIIAVTGYGARIGPDGEPDKVFDFYMLKPVDPNRILRLLSGEHP